MMDRVRHGDEMAETRPEFEDAPDDQGDASRRDVAGENDGSHEEPHGRHDILEISRAAEPAPDQGASEGGDEKDREGKGGPPADENPPKAPPKSLFVVVGLLLLALVAWGGYEHWRSYEDSRNTTDSTVNKPVEVRSTEAKRIDDPVNMTLPGETQALDTANIYPRATGYIDRRLVDIGSRVKSGDLMVHIAAPDLDQQLAQAEAQIGQTKAALVQAKAQVAQAEANVNLAQVNLARASTLTQQGYETQQNRDTQQANTQTQQANVESAKAGVTVAEANIKAQQAVIDRLKALTAFEDVRAPFDGVVTARNVDVGELVSADQSTGTPMFTAVRDSIIRVIIRVPQNVSLGIENGLPAKVVVPQAPEKVFDGNVTRTSSAVLYSSRTLTTEVDIANPTGALRAGLYVTVSFAIPRTTVEVNVPAEALIFDQKGTRIATISDGKVKMAAVNIARDNGTTLDLRDGLKGGERIILNPPATLQDGMQVQEKRAEDDKQDQGNAAGGAKKPTSGAENGGS